MIKSKPAPVFCHNGVGGGGYLLLYAQPFPYSFTKCSFSRSEIAPQGNNVSFRNSLSYGKSELERLFPCLCYYFFQNGPRTCI